MALFDDEVRSRVHEFLRGSASLRELEDWLVQHGSDNRTQLIVKLDHIFAERDLLNEADFCDELRAIVSTIEAGIARTIQSASAGNSVHTAHLQVGGNATIRGRLELADR